MSSYEALAGFSAGILTTLLTFMLAVQFTDMWFVGPFIVAIVTGMTAVLLYAGKP